MRLDKDARNIKLEAVENYLEDMLKSVREMRTGANMVQSATAHNVSPSILRLVIDKISRADDAGDIESVYDASLMTDAEAFLCAVYNLKVPPHIDYDFDEAYKLAVGSLSEKDRKVIDDYYFKHKTLEEIGDELSVTRERVRQMLRRSEKQMRHAVRSNAFILGVDAYKEYIANTELEAQLDLDIRGQVKALNDKVSSIQNGLNLKVEDTKLSDTIKEKMSKCGIVQLRDLSTKTGVFDLLTDLEIASVLKYYDSVFGTYLYPLRGIRIDSCGLSNRVVSALTSNGFVLLLDLTMVSDEELRATKGLGEAGYAELKNKLRELIFKED